MDHSVGGHDVAHDELDPLDREAVLVVPLQQDEVAEHVVGSRPALDHTWTDSSQFYIHDENAGMV